MPKTYRLAFKKLTNNAFGRQGWFAPNRVRSLESKKTSDSKNLGFGLFNLTNVYIAYANR
jgi:hypothetical protein